MDIVGFLELAKLLSLLYHTFRKAASRHYYETKWGFSMTITDRIEINPKVMMGKPVIRGTRLTVELILRKLSEGAGEEDLMEAYSRLTREDIQAAIRYAADTLAHEETI